MQLLQYSTVASAYTFWVVLQKLEGYKWEKKGLCYGVLAILWLKIAHLALNNNHSLTTYLYVSFWQNGRTFFFYK
jgi:hypothetical protein